MAFWTESVGGVSPQGSFKAGNAKIGFLRGKQSFLCCKPSCSKSQSL